MRKQTIVIDNPTKRQIVLDTINGYAGAKPLEVTIGLHNKRRTTPQNRRYWAVLAEIAAVTGHDRDELHDYFKAKFAEPRMIEIGDDTVACYSTRRMTTAEMTRYVEQVEAFARVELGVVLPAWEYF